MDEAAYHDLPDEPELAFLYLEGLFFEELQRLLDQYDFRQDFPGNEYSDYIAKTLAAREPRRVFRRPFRLNHAANAGCSSKA